MLYMTTVTWEPPQRDAVLKRFATQGAKPSPGVKILGMWGDLNGGRVYELSDWGDVNDPKIYIQASYAWNDLCKIEPVAVMNAEEMMKVISSKK
jgi:hypothetical protein